MSLEVPDEQFPAVTTREEFMAAIQDRISNERRDVPIQVNMDDPDAEINLSGIDVSGLTFEGIFSGVDFEESTFTSCNLSGVKFIGCHFDRTTFNGDTSLRGCDFNDSSLFKAVLGDNVDISGTDFSQADDIDKIHDENNNVISITKLQERGAILGEWWLTEGLERQRQRQTRMMALPQNLQRQSSNESDVGVGPFGSESEDEGERPDFSDLQRRYDDLRQEEDNGFDNVFLPENLLSEQQFEALKRLVFDNLENVQDIRNENELMDLIYGIEDSIYEEEVIKDVLLEPLDMIQYEFLESEYKPNQTIKRAIDTLVLNLILESPILSDEGITQSDIIENIYPLAVREIEQNLTSETFKTLQNPFLPQNLATEEEYDNYFDKAL